MKRLCSPLARLSFAVLLPLSVVAQRGKHEVALPQEVGSTAVPTERLLPSLHGSGVGAGVAANDDAEFRLLWPRPGTPPRIRELYAREFDRLRHLELQPLAADTTHYAVNVGILYSLVRTAGGGEIAIVGRRSGRTEGADEPWLPGVTHNAWLATELVRLPMGTVALGKGPNGDLYFYGRANTLHRFDPRTGRLFESNLALPLRHADSDDWLSISTWGGNLYLLNSAGNNLLELAPGRPPRNLLAPLLRTNPLPPFVGRPMNMGVGPDRTFYLKENDTPTLWTFTEKDGELTIDPPRTLNFGRTTTGIEVVPGAPGQPVRLLLGTTGAALSEYDLATDRVVNESRFISTDLAITYPAPPGPRWPPSTHGNLHGWYSGALYVDYAEEPPVGLHFRPRGIIDSVAIAGRRLPVRWYYRQRADRLEFGADSAFTDYVRWHGGGVGSGNTFTVALQSSFFDALCAGLGRARPASWWERLAHGGRRTTHGAATTVLLTYWAGTEGFAQLRPVRAPPPPPPPPRVPAGPGEQPSDSLVCRSGQVLVEVIDYHILDGDQVQFFLDERPLTGVISLRRRPFAFSFPCPDPSGMLVMKTIDAAEGPCTALVTIRQGSFEKAIRLEATVARPARLKFFHRW